MKFSYSNSDFRFYICQQGMLLNIEFVDTKEDISIHQKSKLKKDFLKDDSVQHQMFTYTYGDYSFSVLQYGITVVVNISKQNEPIMQGTLMLSASVYFAGFLETQIPKDKQDEALSLAQSILKEHSSVSDTNGS